MVCFRQCCCGCTLGQGTGFTAVYSVLESIGLFIRGKFWLDYEGEYQDAVNKVGISFLAIGAILLLCCILLLVGLAAEERQFALPWLLVRGLILCVGIIAIVYMTFRYQFDYYFFVPIIINTMFLTYLYLIVISWYQTLDEDEWNDNSVHPSEEQGIMLYGQQSYYNGQVPNNYPAQPGPVQVNLYPNLSLQAPELAGTQHPPYGTNNTEVQQMSYPSPKRF